MARHDAPFANVDTAADDTCLLAFTSGTTGQPKATMHFHRDVMASCVCFPPHVLRAERRRRLHRQPAARLHLRPGRPDACSRCTSAPRRCCSRRPARPTCSRRSPRIARPCCFTAPTSYRAMAAGARENEDRRARRRQPAQVRRRRRGAARGDARALEGGDRHRDHRRHRRDRDVPHLHLRRRGARAARRHRHRRARLPRARASTTTATTCPPARSAASRCKGPTGCRYLDDPRQADYVKGGWNYTGDAYLQDADGYFFYQSRTDDMIISAGYNIAARRGGRRAAAPRRRWPNAR